MRARLVTLILAAGVTLGGCAYGGGLGGMSVGASYGDPYGYGGYGSPYGAQYGSPYGYAGYGSRYGGYGYDPFSRYNPYYRSPYYGSPYYGSPYMGWYDGFYYPGTGYYIYDRDGDRRRLSDRDRKRWVQGIAEMAAATAARRNGETTNVTTQSGSRIAPSSVTRQRVSRSGGLATQIRERARATERPAATRATPRATTRTTTRTKSSSLGSSLRSRVRSSDDD